MIAQIAESRFSVRETKVKGQQRFVLYDELLDTHRVLSLIEKGILYETDHGWWDIDEGVVEDYETRLN